MCWGLCKTISIYTTAAGPRLLLWGPTRNGTIDKPKASAPLPHQVEGGLHDEVALAMAPAQRHVLAVEPADGRGAGWKYSLRHAVGKVIEDQHLQPDNTVAGQAEEVAGNDWKNCSSYTRSASLSPPPTLTPQSRRCCSPASRCCWHPPGAPGGGAQLQGERKTVWSTGSAPCTQAYFSAPGPGLRSP